MELSPETHSAADVARLLHLAPLGLPEAREREGLVVELRPLLELGHAIGGAERVELRGGAAHRLEQGAAAALERAPRLVEFRVGHVAFLSIRR